MSYDLMAFDPVSAPRDRSAFRDWYDQQTEWSEDHSYGDPAVTTEALRSWYDAIQKTHPNMSGLTPQNMNLIDDAAEYSIGHSIIYAAFQWTQAEEVYPLFRQLAVEHKVGFYDVSGDDGSGEIHFPDDTLKPETSGVWREISKEFKELGS